MPEKALLRMTARAAASSSSVMIGQRKSDSGAFSPITGVPPKYASFLSIMILHSVAYRDGDGRRYRPNFIHSSII